MLVHSMWDSKLQTEITRVFRNAFAALRPFPLTFALPALSIVFDARHARVSRFSKPAPPARAKRLQWKPAFKAWSHGRFFSAKCEIFRLFLLNCDYSNKLFLLDCSQFKRNISHFAEKKRSWNQAFRLLLHEQYCIYFDYMHVQRK
jgi:hypothetical protein